MLVLKSVSLATTEQLFSYKSSGFSLEEFSFPGYTMDQWGIKAHNRPWIEESGKFSSEQKIIEVGGAYSLLIKYLSNKYHLEGWIGDDFGEHLEDETLWSRWGNPKELSIKHPDIKYVYEAFGKFSDKYPSAYFDRIFSVSTLEHIPKEYRLDVFKDMNRCLSPGGLQLHTIDISTTSLNKILFYALTDKLPKFLVKMIHQKAMSEIRSWIDLIESSGVKIEASIPNSLSLLDRSLMVESPDVVYRFYPPNDSPKIYRPFASLLLVIEDVQN
jgi:hypothetical protein